MRSFSLALLLVFLPALPALSEPFGPFRTKSAPVTRDARAEHRQRESLPNSDPMAFAFRVYQRTLSAQDGPRCAHSPTCSLYGVQMVRRHQLLGFFLSVDRIWRADRSSLLRALPVDWSSGRRRLYDPIDANDFFLRDIEALHMPELLPPRLRQ